MSILKKLAILLLLFPLLASAQLTPADAISQMKKGINLGNTLEPPYEGDWGNPPTQEYMFDMYKNEGFNVVRVPVRWDKHMGTVSPFKIDETWFKRVEQILDWGLARGLYIVVNSHHDGWIKDTYSNPVNQARFDSLWSQVATRFKNKSEKLIFEICNEPVNMTKAQNDQLHQKTLNTIRKTNPTRLVIFQGIDWGGSDGLINAAIPNDKYLIGSFHSYDPYLFGLEGTGTWGASSDIAALRSKFQTVKDWSIKNNIPVFLGEFGSIGKADYNSRMRHYKAYVELSHSFGFSSCAWDDGGDFKIMYRSTKTWFDDIKDILTHSSALSPKTPALSIVQDTIIKLSWTNPATDYDSIYIQRRTGSGTFKQIAALKGTETTFTEYKLARNTIYYYRVVAHYPDKSVLFSYPQRILLPTYVPKEPVKRQLFTGQALAIPGKIEAENFDVGEDGLTYHDSDTKNIGGALRPNEPVDIYDLGNNKFYVIDNYPGEWLEYTVNIAQKGLYTIDASIAAFAGGGTFKVKIGSVESDIIQAPTTYSWVTAKNVRFSMNLEAGIQIMRISFIDKPLFYIDYLDFKRVIPDGIVSETEDLFRIHQTKDEIILNLNSERSGYVKVYNMTGSLVKTICKPERELRISTRDLHSGVYFVQVKSENQQFSKKIIIP